MQPLQPAQPDRTSRLLVIDDNDGTHLDFRKILIRRVCVLDDMEAVLFGDQLPAKPIPVFEIDSAFQGQEGLQLVQSALIQARPYDLAFVDFRMPPGWDGIETIRRIWEADPLLEIVLCAAYLGQSREEVVLKLGRSEGLDILPKPFESAHVLELAETLTERCRLSRDSQLALR